MMEEWNAAVDQYISSGRDSRCAQDIEVEAKIAHHGGPLHRHCDSPTCGEVETRDVKKLQTCTGCKKVRLTGSSDARD